MVPVASQQYGVIELKLSNLISSNPEVWPIQWLLKGQRQGEGPSALAPAACSLGASVCYSQKCHQKQRRKLTVYTQ